MRILLDGSPLHGRRYGIGVYAWNLLTALAREKSGEEYSVLFQHARPAEALELPEGVAALTRRVPFKAASLLFGSIGVRADAYCGNPDLFHATSRFLPAFTRTRSVLTVYDASFRVEPGWFPDGTAASLDSALRKNLGRADHVIAISEATRRDIIRFYDHPEDRVTAIPLGPRPLPDPGPARGRRTAPYILFVGTVEPRKNVARLIQAYNLIDSDADLVLAGAKGWKSEPVFSAIESSPKRERIRWIEFPSDEALSRLYRDAEVFAYPSLYEGWGLPILEAMSFGVPVVTSRVSSLPEAAGDAAVYLEDPSSIEALRAALDRALSDSTLRRELSRDGLDRCRAFTWSATAKKTLEIYRRLGQE